MALLLCASEAWHCPKRFLRGVARQISPKHGKTVDVPGSWELLLSWIRDKDSWKEANVAGAGGPLSRAGQVSMVATHRDGAAGASLLMTCTLGLKPEMWRESTEAACLCLGNRAKST